MKSKLYRSSTDKKLAGVCGGIAEQLNIDSTIIRLVWAFLTILSWGTGLILYIVAALIIPEEPLAEVIEETEKDILKEEKVQEEESDVSQEEHHESEDL